jgi:phosphoribosyl 1,2-cyclic phosphodiesterase
MRITCWGARGGIPVSGGDYLKYGGDTTCIELRSKDDEIIIIDAGTGIRSLGNKLLKEGRQKYSIIFTHYHWDHVLGFPFFKPLYIKGMEIEIFGCPFTPHSLKEVVARTMTPPNFPVKFEELNAHISYHEISGGEFQIKSISVTPIYLSHPNRGMGYKFVEDNKSFVFLTDNELTFTHPGGLNFQDYSEFCAAAELLLHDAEFTPEEYKRTWGHSVYTDVLELALQAKVRKLGLFHHNQERTDSELDTMVQRCQQIIARNDSPLECFAVYSGMELGV